MAKNNGNQPTSCADSTQVKQARLRRNRKLALRKQTLQHLAARQRLAKICASIPFMRPEPSCRLELSSTKKLVEGDAAALARLDEQAAICSVSPTTSANSAKRETALTSPSEDIHMPLLFVHGACPTNKSGDL